MEMNRGFFITFLLDLCYHHFNAKHTCIWTLKGGHFYSHAYWRELVFTFIKLFQLSQSALDRCSRYISSFREQKPVWICAQQKGRQYKVRGKNQDNPFTCTRTSARRNEYKQPLNTEYWHAYSYFNQNIQCSAFKALQQFNSTTFSFVPATRWQLEERFRNNRNWNR